MCIWILAMSTLYQDHRWLLFYKSYFFLSWLGWKDQKPGKCPSECWDWHLRENWIYFLVFPLFFPQLPLGKWVSTKALCEKFYTRNIKLDWRKCIKCSIFTFSLKFFFLGGGGGGHDHYMDRNSKSKARGKIYLLIFYFRCPSSHSFSSTNSVTYT